MLRVLGLEYFQSFYYVPLWVIKIKYIKYKNPYGLRARDEGSGKQVQHVLEAISKKQCEDNGCKWDDSGGKCKCWDGNRWVEVTSVEEARQVLAMAKVEENAKKFWEAIKSGNIKEALKYIDKYQDINFTLLIPMLSALSFGGTGGIIISENAVYVYIGLAMGTPGGGVLVTTSLYSIKSGAYIALTAQSIWGAQIGMPIFSNGKIMDYKNIYFEFGAGATLPTISSANISIFYVFKISNR